MHNSIAAYNYYCTDIRDYVVSNIYDYCRSVFDSSTLTYIELEHAQSKQHMALLGVADKKIKKTQICNARGAYQALRSEEKRVFRGFLYEKSEARLPLLPRTRDLAIFVASTTTTNDRQTRPITLPLLRMHTQGNNMCAYMCVRVRMCALAHESIECAMVYSTHTWTMD